MTLELQKSEINVIGVDIVIPKELKGLPYFVEASIFKLPFPRNSFDIVYCTFFLMYFKDHPELIEQSLLEFKRVISSNGKIRILRMSNLQEVINIGLKIGLVVTDQPRDSDPQREFLEFTVAN